jgi:hypothetical protein
MKRASRLRTLILGAFCMLVSVRCWAQLSGTGLTGTVTDATGGVVADVQVLAIQDATGLRRETVSSGQGTYEITELPVGAYTVSFLRRGFDNLRYEHVVQSLGQTRTLNATLKVAGTTEELEVLASPPSLDQTANSWGTGIERVQASQLPLNGQNWATLTTLAPGAIDTAGGPGAGNQRSIRYAGRGRDDNNYTYDGIDATYVINQSQLYFVRTAIPLDGISEIRVDTTLSTAQTGATGGAQLNLTSSSGTNQFHGEGFYFLRNDAFDAADPIDALNPTRKPPFHLNQFGGSFGGPIQRDRTFFFAAYEGYQQDLGQTLIGYVPSPSFAARAVAQSAALAPVIKAYPRGQYATSNPDIAQFVGEGNQVGREHSGMFRLDHRVSDATTLFARVNLDTTEYLVPYSPSSRQYLDDQQDLKSSPANGVIALSHVFSPTLLNETRFGFNRGTTYTGYLNSTGSLYAVAVAGLTSLNIGRTNTGVGQTFSGIDDLTWVKGRHVVKAGVEVRFVQMNQGSSGYGTLSFNSLDNFAANQPNKASITGVYPVNDLSKTDYFGYFQDEFKWRPNVTLNLGVRYNVFGIFSEAHGWPNPFDFDTCGPAGYCGVGASFGPQNYGDIDPRIALAWAPAAFEGKTVIRSGFGIYHEDGQLDDQNLPAKNEVLSYTLTPQNCPGLSYPLAPGNPVCVNGTNSPNAEQRNRKDTSVTEWGLSVEQALPGHFVGTASYVGSDGAHLLRPSYINVQDPVTGLRPYPAFSQIPWRGTTGNSEYKALALSLRRSFSGGLLTSANYTWAHEVDDGSNGSGDGDSTTPQNVSCLPLNARQCGELADGAFDVRHAFNANVVYELPFGPGRSLLTEPGLMRSVFGSWSLSSIFSARTGFPVNLTTSATGPDGNTVAQRPNLVPGQPLYLAGGNFNPAAFCTPGTPDPLYPGGNCPSGFGDVPRNFLRGPGAWQLDLALDKRIPIPRQLQLDFRAEVFNVFNHANYANPDGLISAPDFGRIYLPVNTTPVGLGTPRQVQFMLKLTF